MRSFVYHYINLLYVTFSPPPPLHINFNAITESADLGDVARQKRIICTGVRRTAVKVLLRP